MTRMSVVAARNNMADALNRVAYGGERVVLERRGKGIAALVSMDDLRAIEAIEDKLDRIAVRKARKEKGGVTIEQVKTRLGLR